MDAHLSNLDSATADPIPDSFGVIEVHVADVDRLFNAMDPAPFRDRDLDPRAEEFIVEAAEELRRDQSLALIVHLDQQACSADEERVLREAVKTYFADRARVTRRRLRELFRVGRKSLVIGIAFLIALTAIRDVLGGFISRESFAGVLKESLVIAGWVALWRPLEIFLYDWWPIHAEAKLYDRLSGMLVRVVNARISPAEPGPPPM